jgi:hypothetical protein
MKAGATGGGITKGSSVEFWSLLTACKDVDEDEATDGETVGRTGGNG